MKSVIFRNKLVTRLNAQMPNLVSILIKKLESTPFYFMKESAYFHPIASLDFDEAVQLNNIQNFNLVSSEEKRTYRIKTRKNFTSKFQNDIYCLNAVEQEIQAVKDFLECNRCLLPELYKLAQRNAFLAVSSSSVERIFSQDNNILTDERRSLSENLWSNCYLFASMLPGC